MVRRAAYGGAAADFNRSRGFVLTPGGFRHPSLVHRLERGQGVTRVGGVSRKLDLATGVAIDFPAPVTAVGPIPSLGSGWITDALFSPVTPGPFTFSFFTTSWKVPPGPASQNGQTIFLFSSLMDSAENDILQPVLQWGPSQAGGNDHGWSVACWYVDPSGNAHYNDAVSVNEGDTLVGVISMTGQSGAAYDYECSFQGIGGMSLPVLALTARAVATETLECYGIQSCSDYPAALYAAMTSIELQGNGSDMQPNWIAENRVTDCGQHTLVVSTASPGGEVDLFFHGKAPGWNLQRLTGGVARTSGPAAVAEPFASVFGKQEHISYRDVAGTIWDSWYDASNNTWNLQAINGLNGLTVGPTAVSGPFVWVYQQQQHFTYLDVTGAIWDSWYDAGTDSWSLQQINLGGRTNGSAAVGDLFVSVFGQQQHLAYRDVTGTILDCWYDGGSNSWNLQQINLGGRTNGSPATSDPFVSVFGQQQHFAYVDAAGTMWDSWYDAGSNSWNLQQINASGGRTSGPAAVGAPFVSVFGQQEHFAYVDAAGTMWDSWYDGGGNSWNLQQINAGGGRTSGPAAADAPFVSVFGQQQHFAYPDSAGTLWDSWYDAGSNSWNLQSINASGRTNGTAAVGGSFVWVYTQQQHFTYLDASGSIWDAWYDGANNSWNLQQINSGGRTNGPAAAADPFASVFGQQQHVGYLDLAGTVWDAWYDGGTNQWNLQRITGERTKGNPAASGPFICVFGQQQHFAYRDFNDTVWDAWYDGIGNDWNLQQINLDGRTNGQPSATAPFVTVFGEQQHFTYMDNTGTIWDAWYDGIGNNWNLQQINAGGRTNGVTAVGGPFVCVYGQQQHFAYLDAAGTIWDAWYDSGANNWNLQQINAGGRTDGAAAVGGLFVCVYGQQQHFAYVDAAGTIWDAWYDSGTNNWNLQQINAGGRTDGAAAVGGPFVCVYGQQQHFAYLDSAQIIWDAWYDSGTNDWNLQQINFGNSDNGGETAGPLAMRAPFVWVYDQQQHFTYRDQTGTIWDAWYQG